MHRTAIINPDLNNTINSQLIILFRVSVLHVTLLFRLSTVNCRFRSTGSEQVTMATLKVPAQVPSAAEDAEQLRKAFQGPEFV